MRAGLVRAEGLWSFYCEHSVNDCAGSGGESSAQLQRGNRIWEGFVCSRALCELHNDNEGITFQGKIPSLRDNMLRLKISGNFTRKAGVLLFLKMILL